MLILNYMAIKLSNLKVYSFFSGAGFLDLGFETEDFNIVFVNEYNKNFLHAYQFARKQININEPEHGYYQGSIDDLLTGELSEDLSEKIVHDKFDSYIGFIGGPPCPDFSIAGKNIGIDGDNGKLTTSYKQMILKYFPDFFVFENVKGLWTTKKHREHYDKMKLEFEKSGYLLVDKLINSLEYKVPQDRDRIILFGIKKRFLDESNRNSEFLKNNFNWGVDEKYSLDNIKKLQWPKKDLYSEDIERDCPKNIFEDLTIEYWFRKNKVYSHPNAKDCFNPQAIERFNSIREGDSVKKSFKRLHRWRYSPTVAYGNNEVHLHPYKGRRLSVAEALSIQSLPAEFVLSDELTLSDKFKIIGNGVPFLAARAIAHSIKLFLNENTSKERK